MKVSKKLIISLFWLIGLSLIIIATANMSFKVPSIDRLAERNQAEIDMALRTNLKVEMEINAVVMEKSLLILMNQSGLDESTPHFRGLYEAARKSNIRLLGNLEQMATGKTPSDEQINLWESLSLGGLDAAATQSFERLFTEIKLNDLYEERNKLSDRKRSLLFWTLLFQITGLLLTQFGTILELRRKD